MSQGSCSATSSKNALCFRYLLYLLHALVCLLLLFVKDFSNLVFLFEIASVSCVFIILLSTKNFIYGGTYAFCHFLAGSLMLIATAKYHHFFDIIIPSIHYYLLLVSFFIVAGMFPFSFMISYCNSKILYNSSLYLQMLTTKLPFIIILKIFPNIEYLDKILFLFLGIITIAYAIIFIAKISFVSVIAIIPYVVLPFLLVFITDNFHSTIISFVTIFSTVIIAIFYIKEDQRKLFAHINTIFAGILTITTAYLNLFWVVFFCIFGILFAIMMLLISTKKKLCGKLNTTNLELSLIKEIQNIFIKFANKMILSYDRRILQLNSSYKKKHSRDILEIKKFFNKIGLHYLQIDNIECNISLLLLLIVFSSFFLVFYVF